MDISPSHTPERPQPRSLAQTPTSQCTQRMPQRRTPTSACAQCCLQAIHQSQPATQSNEQQNDDDFFAPPALQAQATAQQDSQHHQSQSSQPTQLCCCCCQERPQVAAVPLHPVVPPAADPELEALCQWIAAAGLQNHANAQLAQQYRHNAAAADYILAQHRHEHQEQYDQQRRAPSPPPVAPTQITYHERSVAEMHQRLRDPENGNTAIQHQLNQLQQQQNEHFRPPAQNNDQGEEALMVPAASRKARQLYSEPFEPFSVGEMNVICPDCKAKHFAEERPSNSSLRTPKFGMCCLQGQVSLDIIMPSPSLPWEAFNRSLQDIHRSDLPFPKTTFLFSGDYRQTLSVVPQGSREQIVGSVLLQQIYPLEFTLHSSSYLKLPFAAGNLMPQNGQNISWRSVLARILGLTNHGCVTDPSHQRDSPKTVTKVETAQFCEFLTVSLHFFCTTYLI